jgi:hypothetical protein
MEITCSRCHQTIETDDCYCPACGLPQLLYTAEGVPGQAQPEQWSEVVRDASEVEWKPALRTALMLAVPAGMLCAPLGIFGLFLMAMAAYFAVAIYVRSQRPAWITVGAGARIGLVTGVAGSWMAAATAGATLFAMRFLFHNGKVIDDFWLDYVNQQMVQQWTTMGVDAATIAVSKAWLLSPEGRAGFAMGGVLFLMGGLLLFAVGGGALGARLLARTRRPEV